MTGVILDLDLCDVSGICEDTKRRLHTGMVFTPLDLAASAPREIASLLECDVEAASLLVQRAEKLVVHGKSLWKSSLAVCELVQAMRKPAFLGGIISW